MIKSLRPTVRLGMCLIGAFAIGLPGAAAANSLCASGEHVWFDAAIDGTDERISVCGADIVGDRLAWLQFRQGQPGAVMLAWPREKAGSAEAFTLRIYTRARTSFLKLEFDCGDETYAILEGYEADFDPPHTIDFRIRKQDQESLDRMWKLDPTSDAFSLMRLEYHVNTAPFDE